MSTSSPRVAHMIRVFAIAFVLNGIWEVAQLSAFAGMDEIQLWGHLAGCSTATLLDGLFIAGVYLVASWIWEPDWIGIPRRAGYGLATVLGAMTAVIVEWLALSLDWWQYTDAMPRLPGTNIGLFPFIQLTLLTPLTMAISARMRRPG